MDNTNGKIEEVVEVSAADMDAAEVDSVPETIFPKAVAELLCEQVPWDVLARDTTGLYAKTSVNGKPFITTKNQRLVHSAPDATYQIQISINRWPKGAKAKPVDPRERQAVSLAEQIAKRQKQLEATLATVSPARAAEIKKAYGF